MTDFTKWLPRFIRPGESHPILPGREVHLTALDCPHGLTADQAVEMAIHLIECAGLSVKDALFADGREPTRNERHLLNLLSWRDREAQRHRHEVDHAAAKVR